jgi:high affinity choline transporter 7
MVAEMGIQLAFIAAFYILIFLVGVYGGRKGVGVETSAGLLLAGRKMPIFMGVFTMIATWVGGGYINGTAEAVYDQARGLVWAQAPWGFALSLVLGGLFFAKRMRRARYTTLLDPFEERYGKQTAAWLFLPALVGEVFWCAAILVALGTTFSTVIGFDATTSILVSAAIALAYTMVGGLWSVSYTDVVQLVFILLGLSIAIPFALARTGGAEVVASTYVAQMPGFPQGPAIWVWLDFALLLVFGGIPWQVYFQRVLASRDEQTAVRLSIVAGVGCLIMAVPAMIIGAIGVAADWSATPPGVAPEPALVLPYVLQYLTPSVVATVGLAAVAAAVMSSIDSSILSGASMFVWNVYRPLVRPHASDREIRLALRLAIVAVGAAATGLALVTSSVYALWFLCADLVYVILFPQLVLALYCRRINRIGVAAGAVIALVLRLGGGEPALGLPALIHYPLQTPDGCCFPFRTFAMLSGLVTTYLVAQATLRWQPAAPPRHEQSVTEPPQQ